MMLDVWGQVSGVPVANHVLARMKPLAPESAAVAEFELDHHSTQAQPAHSPWEVRLLSAAVAVLSTRTRLKCVCRIVREGPCSSVVVTNAKWG